MSSLRKKMLSLRYFIPLTFSVRSTCAMVHSVTAKGRCGVGIRRLSDAVDDQRASGGVSSPPEQEAVDNSSYNCKEYYSYNDYSYYDIDAMCVDKRIPQPNANFKDAES